MTERKVKRMASGAVGDITSVYSTHLDFFLGDSFPFPFRHLFPLLPSSRPLRRRGSGPSGGAYNLRQRVRSEPGRQTYFVHWGVNLHPFDCLLTNNFLCLLSIKRMFPWYVCKSLSPPNFPVESRCLEWTLVHSLVGWLDNRVVSVLDSGAEGPGFKSQSRRCRVTVLGKLFTPIMPLFTKQ